MKNARRSTLDAQRLFCIKCAAVLVLTTVMLYGCGQMSQKELDLYDNKVLQIKIPCRTAEWDAQTTVEQDGNTTTVRSKISYRQGKYRLEIFDSPGENRQVILLDAENLFVLGYDNKAYKYPLEMRESEVFLRKVFVNTGLGRKPEVETGKDVYNGQKCRVYEYDILRSINGLYLKAKVREWRNNSGVTVKIQTYAAKAQYEANNVKKYVGPVTETYETKNYKCGATLMGMLFEVPMGMEIVDYREMYGKQLKKAGKAVPVDSGSATMTVNKQ